ncbi:MAG: T9SS type A sorting domain-containing protein [Flavobacteriales bacterium]|nr:T9SS type A sorting domain-containing protein [Flavobacteriales bacterium]
MKLQKLTFILLFVNSFTYAQVELNLDKYLHVNGASGMNEVKKIEMDPSGNLFIAGILSGTADFDMDAGVNNISTGSSTNVPYLAKYNTSGVLQWVRTFPSVGGNAPVSITFNTSSEIYFSFGIFGASNADPVNGTAPVNSSNGSGIIVKLNAAGEYVAHLQLPSVTSIIYGSYLMAVGKFNGTYDFNPGPGIMELTAADDDGFILRIDHTNMTPIMVTHLYGLGSCDPTVIKYSFFGEYTVAGHFTGSLVFEKTVGVEDSLVSAGDNDVFVMQVYPFVIVQPDINHFVRIGGSGFDMITSLDINTSDVFVAGQYQGTIDIDPGTATQNITTNGGFDAFLVSLNSNLEYNWHYNVGGSGFQDFINDVSIQPWNNQLLLSLRYIDSGDADLDPGAATVTLPGWQHAALVVLDYSGGLVNAFQINDGSSGVTINVAKFKNNSSVQFVGNSFLVGGKFNGTGVFVDELSTFSLTAAGSEDGYFIEYDINASSSLYEAEANGIKIYPNPFTDIVYFEAEKPGMLDIFSADGKYVESIQIQANKQLLPLQAYPQGLYIVRFTDNQGNIIQHKLIRQ